MKNYPNYLLSLLVLFSLAAPAFAQRGRKPIVFAVLNDGKTLEPIAYVDKKELTTAVDGASDQKTLKSFSALYYKPKTVYRLIFGGSNTGTVSVIKNDPTVECSSSVAEAQAVSKTTKLGGFVMGLATSVVVKSPSSGVRRRPTLAERTEVEALVSAEFATKNVTAKTLRYHNLTALDLDNDKKIELVGSYWTEIDKTTRALLFFIAEKNAAGKYEIGYGEFRNVKQDEVMSGEIKSVDEGVYHELLLDVLDYDDDGRAEVFTYIQGFEGSSFNAYRKKDGKWSRAYEGASYHCGY